MPHAINDDKSKFELDEMINSIPIIVIDVVINSLPLTITNDRLTPNHVCIKAELGTPSAQKSDWTVSTGDGTAIIAGSISGTTTARLYFEYSESLVDSKIEFNGADFVVEHGISGGWRYRKWNSGNLDAERVWNVGQVTVWNVLSNDTRCSASISASLPQMAISGSLEIVLMGNSSNSGIYLEHISSTSFRIAKTSASSVTLQNVTLALRTIGARWK